MSERRELDGIQFVAATPDWLPRMAGLLGSMKVPAEDISPASLPAFELASDGEDRFVGMAGLALR